MAAILIALAAVILVLGTARSRRALASVKDVSRLIARHRGWTAAIMLAAVVGVFVGPQVAVSVGLYRPSEHVTVQGGCAEGHVDAFGTHWIGGEPVAMIPRPFVGAWTWSSTGVIRRVKGGNAIFTPDGGGDQIDLRENPGGVINLGCAIQ